MINDTELKPCPFCGGEAELRETNGTERHGDLFSVGCINQKDCCTVGNVFSGGNTYMMSGVTEFFKAERKKSKKAKRKAIESWNTRADKQPVDVDDLKEELFNTTGLPDNWGDCMDFLSEQGYLSQPDQSEVIRDLAGALEFARTELFAKENGFVDCNDEYICEGLHNVNHALKKHAEAIKKAGE